MEPQAPMMQSGSPPPCGAGAGVGATSTKVSAITPLP